MTPPSTLCSRLEVWTCRAVCVEQSACHEKWSNRSLHIQLQAEQLVPMQYEENAIRIVPGFHFHASEVSSMGQTGYDETFGSVGMLQWRQSSSFQF